jgi:hypothetical protein
MRQKQKQSAAAIMQEAGLDDIMIFPEPMRMQRAKALLHFLSTGAGDKETAGFAAEHMIDEHKRNMMMRTAETIACGGKGGRGVWARLVRDFCDGRSNNQR